MFVGAAGSDENRRHINLQELRESLNSLESLVDAENDSEVTRDTLILNLIL